MLIVFSTCEKENAKPRSYPRLSTKPVSNITGEGARFTGEVLSLGTEPINEHGFVWSEGDPNIRYSNFVKLGSRDIIGTFTADIVSSLRENVKYYVRSYVQTPDHIVYGETVSFMSLGSNAPVITGFEPHSAQWLDTLFIKGKHFSWITWENIVKINQTVCPSLVSTDTTLMALVPAELADLKGVLSVELAQNINTHTTDTFSLIVPVVQDFSPKQVRWGDTISVTGNGFINNKLKLAVTGMVGGFSADVADIKNDKIKLVVPLGVASLSSVCSLKIHNQNYTLGSKVDLLAPFISGVVPNSGTWGTIVTLKGKFHPTASRNSVKMGGYNATIVKNCADSLTITTPSGLKDHLNTIVNAVAPFNITAADTFHLYGPRIDSISPLSGTSNCTVTIYGNYFSSGTVNSTVQIGSTNATVTSISKTRIVCKVPLGGVNGLHNINVITGNQNVVSKDQFDLQNPVISSFSPLTANFNDEITLTGQYLKPGNLTPEVIFNNYYRATIVSSSQNQLVFKVPSGTDSIPRKLQLWYAPIQLNIFSANNFVLAPPLITGVSPNPFTAMGQDITITGTGFDPGSGNNQVLWDIYRLTVKTETGNEIIASLPAIMPRNNGRIIIQCGGYKRTFAVTSNINSKWLRIDVPKALTWQIIGGLNTEGVSFSAGGLGYLIDYMNGSMSSYNPSTGLFSMLGTFPSLAQVPGMSVTVNRDTAYIMAGSKGMLRYDANLNNWVPICSLPTPFSWGNGVAFSLNNKIYYGLVNNGQIAKELWVYNRSANSWSVAANFPVTINDYITAYFTIDNKGYVIFANRQLWQFDPDLNSWTQKTSYPQASEQVVNKVAPVINGIAYVGTGNNTTAEFQKYDPLIDSWSPFTTIPSGPRYCTISFVIGNKAYIGLGIVNGYSQRDFFEFDPTL